MQTISRLFDSHGEAARVAGDLVAAGIPCVRIAIIGPYHDEIGILRTPAVILGAVAGVLACLSAVAVYGVSSLPAGLSATAMIGALCGGGAGALLGAFVPTAKRPDDRSAAEGIVLVTAHVDETETDIAQAVLGGCAPLDSFVAEAA
ncbi:hypothetical protein FJ934_12980 [Mesorhizobium sp. B2-4-12]|uniref:hypothetical protein n=1 Tax=Mesorhizobium sp. B2-4-12 TaxID=2589937 RepID=UPI00112E17A4|nr:hypothetical protein [Mesorhizobium sp. B2-4-12]TPK95035.1 hypothetical protein FJ934_12980 [Mesorhizobium sp. B2-4-12]